MPASSKNWKIRVSLPSSTEGNLVTVTNVTVSNSGLPAQSAARDSNLKVRSAKTVEQESC